MISFTYTPVEWLALGFGLGFVSAVIAYMCINYLADHHG